MTFTPRKYQAEAEDAVHTHVCTKDTDPCVVIPTGGGKSVIMASLIRRWHGDAPYVRGCILAHRKELVQQNAEKLNVLYPDGHVGIFSAGLGRRDYDSPILFASIDSIYKRSGEFAPFDFIFVDEAHRIPPSGEGKYRTFIAGCRRFNSSIRVVGWTATPFRMGCGPICHKDHILNEVCYEAHINDLIKQGYLSDLRSKASATQPDLADVKRNHGGDYVVKDLSAAANKSSVVGQAVREAVGIMNLQCRRATIFFCVDVEHCTAVSKKLHEFGVNAPCVTGKTKRDARDRIIKDFKSKRIRAVCCVNVLTEGFDAPHIDCIVLLRPTLSAGLFSQMVGRGLRIDNGKRDCIVLDFAGCIDEHGPIDLLGTGLKTVMAVCPECRESFSRAIRACPECGWVIPKVEMERLEAVEKERRMHSGLASKKSILSREPETYYVNDVIVSRHIKAGSPDSVKVQYRCGLSVYREWVCLDHDGFAGKKAQRWWSARFRNSEPVTTNDALSDLLNTQTIKDWTKTITVKRSSRYFEVVGYNQQVSE